jgi:hypothetical protein
MSQGLCSGGQELHGVGRQRRRLSTDPNKQSLAKVDQLMIKHTNSEAVNLPGCKLDVAYLRVSMREESESGGTL